MGAGAKDSECSSHSKRRKEQTRVHLKRRIILQIHWEMRIMWKKIVSQDKEDDGITFQEAKLKDDDE